MPIRSEHRWLYPIDWPQLSAVIRFERAQGACEGCGRPHGQLVLQAPDGRWLAPDGAWRDDRGRRVRQPVPGVIIRWKRVVIACCHRDHDPGNNRPRNLCAWCGRCHLAHDRPEHRRRARLTRRRRRASGDLFEGAYPRAA